MNQFKKKKVSVVLSFNFNLIQIKDPTNNLQIQIESLQPDAMDVGENLEETLNLLSSHQELCSKLKVFFSFKTFLNYNKICLK